MECALASVQAATMIYALKKIPQELRRFAVLVVVAGMVTTAVIYSRDQHVTSEDIEGGSQQAFQQPKNRQQVGRMVYADTALCNVRRQGGRDHERNSTAASTPHHTRVLL